MLKMKPTIALFVLSLSTITLVTGCGSGGDPLPEQSSIPTQGKLLVDGKPFGPASLAFVHDTNQDAPGLEATVSEDGTFDSLVYTSETAPQGSYRVLMSEDVAAMSATGVPVVKPVTVEISVPAEGQSLTLEVSMTSTGDSMMGGSPDPDAATTE